MTDCPTRVSLHRAPYTPRLWRCANGHLLGRVIKPGGVRRLELYAFHGLGIVSQVVMAVITGPAEIHCQECQAVRVWDLHEDGMQELLARRGRIEP